MRRPAAPAALAALGRRLTARRDERRGVVRAPGARVARSAVLSAGPGGRVVLGPAAVVGPRCVLRAGPGAVVAVDGQLDAGSRLVAATRITVETGARLGPDCVVVDADPVTDDVERPVREQGLTAAPVRIGAGALLGPRVAVLRGVVVGAGATVLAQSVCTRDVPAGREVGGTPAHRPFARAAAPGDG